MAQQGVRLEILGRAELREAVAAAQGAKYQSLRHALKVEGQDIRSTFIQRDLSGRPGINAPMWRKGKYVFSFVSGDTDRDIGVSIGINKALRVHEEGFTFHPVKGQWIYIRANKRRMTGKIQKGTRTGQIVARVKQVTIPKRTHFVDLVQKMAPEAAERAARAMFTGVVEAVQSVPLRPTGKA